MENCYWICKKQKLDDIYDGIQFIFVDGGVGTNTCKDTLKIF